MGARESEDLPSMRAPSGVRVSGASREGRHGDLFCRASRCGVFWAVGLARRGL
ncbi:hypothetical protein SAMN05661093_07906 [Kibdelosporangium aridum]|uniref:Uncharacterized protein n=1 Tax=Kibdelosporangium aridum TaxID=2030 RepID=A0A1Y5Y340_KIBAR|nr:hypothetical protein SAMN05661093_07906 [Kibdelosporangium aridum]